MKYTFHLFCLILIVSCNSPQQENNIFSTDHDGLYSLIVQKEGKIVFQNFKNGKTNQDLFNVQSITKSIMAILIGIAIDKGIIKDENQRIADLLPQLFSDVENERKREITIKDILNQKTGLEWKGHLEHQQWINHKNPNLFVINKPLLFSPNTKYNYNTGATHLLSVIIQEVTQKSTLEFAQEHLFDKLKIEQLNWAKRNDGNYDGGGLGLEMKSHDLLSIGELILNNGKIGSEQIVSKKWIDKIKNPELKEKTDWGIRKSKHGYCWYQANFQGANIVYAMGYGGQFIITIPQSQIIIVSTFNHDTPNGIEQQVKFLNKNLVEILNWCKE